MPSCHWREVENALVHVCACPDTILSEEVLKPNVSNVPAILSPSCVAPSLPGLLDIVSFPLCFPTGAHISPKNPAEAEPTQWAGSSVSSFSIHSLIIIEQLLCAEHHRLSRVSAEWAWELSTTLFTPLHCKTHKQMSKQMSPVSEAGLSGCLMLWFPLFEDPDDIITLMTVTFAKLSLSPRISHLWSHLICIQDYV